MKKTRIIGPKRPLFTDPNYTTCRYCKGLLRVEHGPICGNCYSRLRAEKRVKRNKRKERKAAAVGLSSVG